MRCHFIQHAHFETPGSLRSWAENKKMEIKIYHPYQGDDLPTVAHQEPVIFLGGPQSAREYQQYDYLEQEVVFIKHLIQHKHPVLGICLGAQLIGQSLGANTERSPEKEVGVFPLTLTPEGKTHPYLKDFPRSFDVMHWHYDMPGLPFGAKVLAQSQGCARQIIEFAPHILGLQCHFEATKAWLADLEQYANTDLQPSKFTQTKEELQQIDFNEMNSLLAKLLDKWLLG